MSDLDSQETFVERKEKDKEKNVSTTPCSLDNPAGQYSAGKQVAKK